MFDPVCESGSDEAFLNEGAVLEGALAVCFQKLHLLGDVGALLVIWVVLVHVSKESPVIEIIDSVLKEGIHCLIAPEAAMEPGR